MARPVDWSPLAGSDPVPGDPYEVARMGRHYTDVADAIERAAGKLRQLAGGNDDQESDAVDALDDDCQQVADDISRAHQRYAGVGAALTAYAPKLEQAQADSLAALTAAQQADSNHRAATTRQNDALSPAEHDAAQQDIDAATTALGSARTKLQHAVEDRDNAARTAIDAVKDVQDSGDLNDSWWDNWGHKIVEAIQKIASYVALVAGVLALCVGWIPIIGQALAGILGTIALVATAISLICNIALAATGYGDWMSVVWDAVGLCTFGLGRVFSAAARGSATGLRGAARLSAGKIAGAGGTEFRSLVSGTSLSGLSRNAARGILADGRAAGALSRSNILASFRSLPADFASGLTALRSGANWSAARAGLGPAFRNLFSGNGLTALYGETELLESAAFRGTLHPEVLAHPLTSGAIRYTSITTGVAVLSNLGGNANDFRELLTDVGVFDSPDFDLNVSQDPLR